LPFVFVVDDRTTNRKILGRLARSLEPGMEAMEFATPSAALAAMADTPPDLIITDFNMPEMDGAEFVKRCRLQFPDREVPIIVITAYEDKTFRYRALEAGATDFLLSPIDHREFRTRANNLLMLGRQQRFIRQRADMLERELEIAIKQRSAALLRSEEKLRRLIDTVPALITESDASGRCLLVNSFHNTLTLADDGGGGTDTIEGLFGKEYWRRHAPIDRGIVDTGQVPPAFEEEMTDRAGQPRILLTTKTPLPSGDGRIEGVVTVSIDITARKLAEEELRIAAVTFQSQEGIIITDPRGVIQRVNQAFSQVSGFDAAESVGKTPAILKSGRHRSAFYQTMWQTLAETGYWQGEIWNRRKNGEIYPAWLAISAVTAPDASTTHYIGSFFEITKQKEAEAQIHRLAYYDPLTNLPNRRLLYDRIGQALAGSSRNGQFGALIFLDLDNFKNLNDTMGHDVGDQLLVETARRILGILRDYDTVARLGGDEFVIMVEDLSPEMAEAAFKIGQVAEKIRDAIAAPDDLGGRKFSCAASLGITLFCGAGDSVDTLLKQADLAMYKAKSAGRNTLRFFDPAMQTALEERITLESDLLHGLQEGQFVLHYQPQVDHRGRLIGAEGLIRWHHPKRGMVYPGEFIPMAEESGLILGLGQWVLETACRQIVAWSKRPETALLVLAVNVSARQFHQEDFVESVLEVVRRSGADPHKLKLELTESMLLANIEDIIAKMEILKSHGLNFALDDFGTGYSSLLYLKRLPLSQLKIDQSFVRDVLTNAKDAAIAVTMVALGQNLGLSVLVEGVETEAQWEFLNQHGCHACQGFLFGRPVPIETFDAQLLMPAPI